MSHELRTRASNASQGGAGAPYLAASGDMVAVSDRVPCPHCGQLIHPIAGRCKHCKTDLVGARGIRAAAPASLPSLATPAPGTLRAPVVAPIAAPIASADPYADSGPVLPPRVTARQLAAQPERAWWKSWPTIVIGLAAVAIVVAIVLLVWPPHDKVEGALPVGPAPDRMDTSPLVPEAPGNGATPTPSKPTPPTGSGGADPWGKADPPKDPAPTRPLPPDPVPRAPDPDDDDDALGLGGILGGTPGSAGGPTFGGLGGAKSVGMLSAMLQHGCARVTACGGDPMLKQTCDQLQGVLGKTPLPRPTCAAATECLEKIDALDCDLRLDDFAKIMSMQSKFASCVDAMQCS